MKLSKLTVGDHASITGYATESRSFRQKLLARGLTPGARFKVKRRALFGCPLEISVRGVSIIMREDELQFIEVEKINA